MEILLKVLSSLSIVGVISVAFSVVWVPLNGFDFFIPYTLFGGAVLWFVSFMAFKKLNDWDLNRKKNRKSL